MLAGSSFGGIEPTLVQKPLPKSLLAERKRRTTVAQLKGGKQPLPSGQTEGFLHPQASLAQLQQGELKVLCSASPLQSLCLGEVAVALSTHFLSSPCSSVLRHRACCVVFSHSG